MIITQSADAISGSFADLWFTIMQYVPAILAAVAIFLIGWVVGMILYRVIVEVAQVLRVNEALKRAGFGEVARHAGFDLDVGRFIGSLVMWFVVLVFLLASFDVLGLNRVTIFLQTVVLLYLPQVIVAALILIIGAIVAEMVKKIVTGSARAAGARSGHFAGSVAKWAIWITAVLAALDQLGIAANFVQTLFTGVVVGLSLAFGLAFGLGGKDAAARAIEHIRAEVFHHE